MKKILSLSLALLLMCGSTVVPAYATTIENAGTPTTVPVVLTVDPAVFSVTVPTELPVHINGAGEVSTPEFVSILNNSAAPVEVKNVSVTAAENWTLIDFTTDKSTFKIDEHKLGLNLNGVATGANGVWTFDASKWPAIAAKNGTDAGEYQFNYQAILPPQTNNSNGQTMANVVFTIGWAD